jgi:hypothetical protein
MSEFERYLKKVLVHEGDRSALAARIEGALRAQSQALYRASTPAKNRGVPCEIEWCDNVAYAKSLCNAHYIRLRAGKDMDAPFHQRRRAAECAECGAPVDSKGGWSLCKPHYRTRRRKIIRAACVEHLGGACARCGGVFPTSVYDFHHNDPTKKANDPSALIDSASVDVIAAEAEKCTLMCANCHRIEHHE